MKLTGSMLVFAALVLTSTLLAQPEQVTPPQPQDWVPQAIQDLGQTASSHSDFTFSHSMLVLAAKVDQDDDSLRRIVAGVDGVSVHRFHFQNGVTCDPGILAAIKAQYNDAGWEHLAGGHKKEQGPGETDLWFQLQNTAIRKIAVLAVGHDQVNFITVSGSISPLDLLHLAGHFGIPPIQGGIKVPNTAASQPTQPPAY